MNSHLNIKCHYKRNSATGLFRPLIILIFLILNLSLTTSCSRQNSVSPPDGMIALTDDTINHTIKNSTGHLLVHFTSYDPNCGYCSESNPYIDQLMLDYKHKLKVGRISWEPWNSHRKQSPTITKQYWIRGLPMFIYYKDGQEIWRGTGYTDDNTNKITKLLKNCCS